MPLCTAPQARRAREESIALAGPSARADACDGAGGEGRGALRGRRAGELTRAAIAAGVGDHAEDVCAEWCALGDICALAGDGGCSQAIAGAGRAADGNAVSSLAGEARGAGAAHATGRHADALVGFLAIPAGEADVAHRTVRVGVAGRTDGGGGIDAGAKAEVTRLEKRGHAVDADRALHAASDAADWLEAGLVAHHGAVQRRIRTHRARCVDGACIAWSAIKAWDACACGAASLRGAA